MTVMIGVGVAIGIAILWSDRAGEEPEVVWAGDFTAGGWQNDFGVVVESRANAEVVEQGPGGRDGVLRITFGEDGDRWGMDYRHAFESLDLPGLEAVNFAYDVYFPHDFEFIGDGKLGGVAGIAEGVEPLETSSGGNYDERSFSARAMWKEDRGVVMYLYARSAAGRDLRDPQHFGFGIAERFVAPDGRTRGIFTPGTWHRVEHRIELNTPGQADGVYQLYVDGHRGVDLDDVEYRTEDHPDLRINQLMSTWFFGGDPTQYPTRVNTAYTDDWVLSVPREASFERHATERQGTDR